MLLISSISNWGISLAVAWLLSPLNTGLFWWQYKELSFIPHKADFELDTKRDQTELRTQHCAAASTGASRSCATWSRIGKLVFLICCRTSSDGCLWSSGRCWGRRASSRGTHAWGVYWGGGAWWRLRLLVSIFFNTSLRDVCDSRAIDRIMLQQLIWDSPSVKSEPRGWSGCSYHGIL